MKLAFTFIIFFFSTAIFAQDIDNKIKSKKNIRIGVNFSPDRCYRVLKNGDDANQTNLNIAARNSVEIPCIGFTSGITASYSLNEIFSIEAGLQFANKRYQTKEQHLIWGSNPFVPGTTTLFIFNHYYAEMPLKIITTAGNDKVKFNFGIGAAPGYFLRYTLTFDEFDANDKLTETKTRVNKGYNKFNFSLLTNIGVSYHYNKKLCISFEPTYRHGIIKIKNTPIQEHLWSMGLNIGYSYLIAP